MIKEMVEKTGLKQQEMADKIGIRMETLSKIINSQEYLKKASFDTIISLCNILGCMPMDLTPYSFEAGVEYNTTKAMFDFTKQEITSLFTAEEKKYFADMLKSIMSDLQTLASTWFN